MIQSWTAITRRKFGTAKIRWETAHRVGIDLPPLPAGAIPPSTHFFHPAEWLSIPLSRSSPRNAGGVSIRPVTSTFLQQCSASVPYWFITGLVCILSIGVSYWFITGLVCTFLLFVLLNGLPQACDKRESITNRQDVHTGSTSSLLVVLTGSSNAYCARPDHSSSFLDYQESDVYIQSIGAP